MFKKYYSKNVKGFLGILDVDERIILKWVFKKRM
jgi:hypothetical protein